MSEQIVSSLSQYRQTFSVTQEELAKNIGVTRQTIIAIEKGNYTPSVALALKIAQFFKTSVESLFTITSDTDSIDLKDY